MVRFRQAIALLVVASGDLGFVASASANGIGESRPWQFRSFNERQVLLNILQVTGGLTGTGVGGLNGLGTQTGTASSIVINGDNNTINVTQDNSGDQTIEDNSQ